METIKKGSKGEDVKTLQRALNLTADGVFGPKTEDAVKEYQKALGLEADGIVGANTWAALGIKDTNSKCVHPDVVYMPLSACVSKTSGRTPKYLAIHYTAGASSAAGKAKALKAMWEKAKRASADFAVDDAEMVQFNPDPSRYYCWAVGDAKASHVNTPDGRNVNTISIEVCSTLTKGTSASKPNHSGWGFTSATLDNAVRLAKILMEKYNIPVERVVRHYDISGKLCPGLVGWNDGRLYKSDGSKTSEMNNSDKWLAFKWRLK